ncbi:hypothetical protein [Spiroplasma citri]|uniref:hypothetical protein n=1 Tax=Spiroplasma citri TaxID=2133 RepID=UPI0011BAF8AA|nr:hypothetical protein [Spiroplasma citri]QED25000.1 hypothetical protein FRX96_06275 [Spiroplasma citri]
MYRYITKSFEKLETDVIQIEILTKQINWMNAAENQLKELNNNKENNNEIPNINGLEILYEKKHHF